MLTMNQLTKALNIDKGYLSKLIKKLNMKPDKIRGNNNQWEYTFQDKEIEKLLTYRIGIKHNLKEENGKYSI